MKYSILSIMYIVLFIILSCYKILINAFTDLELKQLVDAFNNVSIIIDNKFSTLDNKITMLDNKINGLKQLMIESFRNTHFLGRSKVKILKNSTGEVISPCDQHSTYHSVYYDGYVVALFNPHMECSTFENVILHPYYDLGILLDRKYSLPYAIDISIGASPELGDDVMAYGHGVRAKIWGKISDFIEKGECDTLVKHFNGSTRVCAGEWIVQAHQHPGMSGSAVANGCGYLGIAHAVVTFEDSSGVTANFASVIGIKTIQQFISDNKDKLVKHQDTSIVINELPFASFVECRDSIEVEVEVR
jgi:hypothetical protein